MVYLKGLTYYYFDKKWKILLNLSRQTVHY